MQVVKYLTTSPDHAKIAHHQLQTVTRGSLILPKSTADIVVSHLAVSWHTLPALVALRLRYGRARLVHVEHSYTEGFVCHNVPNIRRFETMLRLAFGQFGRVVAVSAGQRDWLRRRDLVAQDHLSLVRSFGDLTPFLSVAPRAGPVRHFGAIGRLEPQKGFDLLIKSFRKTVDPDLRLSIFGTGSQQEKLKELATGDPRICFCGHSETPQDAYRSVDAVVMPSRWEAYGLVAIEAICAGRPLICSGVDGLQDHASLGAIICSDVDRGISKLLNRRAASRQDPANVMEQLKNENLLAWDTLIMRTLRRS